MTDLTNKNNSDLLHSVKTICAYEEIFQRSLGEYFNIFEILGIGHYEVTTHSRFLAELLSPKGSHKQGGTFLKEFLTCLQIPEFDLSSAKIEIEKNVGEGRLDLVISDKMGNCIVIENKIYAKLQDRQLERYNEYLSNLKKCKTKILLFLTLGALSENEYKDIKNKNLEYYRHITYQNEILNWLNLCRKETASIPVVREAITQYINLIKILTHQNIGETMNNNIKNDVLKNRESFEAFIRLKNSYEDIRRTIIENFFENIISKLKDEFDSYECENNNSAVFFCNKRLKRNNLRIGLAFERVDNYTGFFIGIASKDVDKYKLDSNFNSEFSKLFKIDNPNKFWPASAYISTKDFGDDVLGEIHFGNFNYNEIINSVIKLKELTDSYYA